MEPEVVAINYIEVRDITDEMLRALCKLPVTYIITPYGHIEGKLERNKRYSRHEPQTYKMNIGISASCVFKQDDVEAFVYQDSAPDVLYYMKLRG